MTHLRSEKREGVRPACRGPKAIAVIAAVSATMLGACGSLPTPQSPQAEAFVRSEVASVPARGEYRIIVADLTDAEQSERGIREPGVRFESLTANIGFELGRRVSGPTAPPEGRFLGSTEHLRLAGAGTVVLEAPATVLGMHVVLDQEQVLMHRWMASNTEAKLLVTGIDTSGRPTGTVKSIPAISTPDYSRVDEAWAWVDLSILGEVRELEMSFETPVADLPVILVDNFTFSPDFNPDPDFFTIALLPSTATSIESYPDVLAAQVTYLSGSRRATGEPIVYVSHLGGIVADGSEEDQWELADETMRVLDRAVPFGIAPGASDLADPDDPGAGSPLFLEYFPVDRIAEARGSSGVSEDGYSSYRIIDSPAGDILALQLAVDPVPATVEWAQRVLDRNRNTTTLVTTSSYLEVYNDVVRRYPAPILPVADESSAGLSAQELWEQVIYPNPQVFMVACGDGPMEALQISRNTADQSVIEILSSYVRRPEGGEGYLRLLRFYPRRNELRILTYSPWLDTYEQDSDSFLRIPIDVSGRLGLD